MSSKIKNRHHPAAQVTLEYLLLFTALVVGFILTALAPNNYFQGVSINILQERAMTMDAFTSTLDGSDPNIPALGSP